MAKILELNKNVVSKKNMEFCKEITKDVLLKNSYEDFYQEILENAFDFEGYAYETSMIKGIGSADNIKAGLWQAEYFIVFDLFKCKQTGKTNVAVSPTINMVCKSDIEKDCFVLRSYPSTKLKEIEEYASKKHKVFASSNCTLICRNCSLITKEGVHPECYDKYLDNLIESRVLSNQINPGKALEVFDCENFDVNSFIKFGSTLLYEENILKSNVYTIMLTNPFKYVFKFDVYLENIGLTELCEIFSECFDKGYGNNFIYESKIPFENIRLEKINLHENNILTCEVKY